jgi:LPXTG-motif cell wall-anchored protein
MKAARILLASLAALLTVGVHPASAQTTTTSATCTASSPSSTEQYPPSDCTLVADRTEVGPGGTVTLSGKCPAGTGSVAFRLDPGGVDLGSTTPDGNGNYSKQVTIPSGTAPGNYTITASCTGVLGAGVTRTVAITVVGAAALPRTGSASTLPLTGGGVALVVVGLVAVAVVRRRREHHTAA